MLAAIGVGLVAAAHVGFMVLESVLWATPTGRRIFRMTEAQAEASRVLASNQGMYNLGLAVGLIWALAVGNQGALLFLLAYIVAMGLYGGATAKASIIGIQALPAAVTFALVWLEL